MLELGFRPTRGQVFKFAEAFSIAFWAIVIAIGTYAQFWLPYWRGGSPRPSGCYFTDAMIVFVQCNQTGADELLAGILTYCWMWSWGIGMTLAIFPLVILIPYTWLAIAALFFAARFLIRRAPRIPE
jgi:hypothetical protein